MIMGRRWLLWGTLENEIRVGKAGRGLGEEQEEVGRLSSSTSSLSQGQSQPTRLGALEKVAPLDGEGGMLPAPCLSCCCCCCQYFVSCEFCELNKPSQSPHQGTGASPRSSVEGVPATVPAAVMPSQADKMKL